MILKTTLTLNRGNQGVAMNTFFHSTGADSPSWSTISAALTTYINNLYAPMRNFMSTAMTLISCTVEEVNSAGEVIGLLGSITPTVDGNSANDMNSGPTAMTIGARTLYPKIRGSKRFAGVTDGNVVNQLLTNAALNGLAQAAAAYITVYSSGGVNFSPGVISTTLPGFAHFSLTGAWAKNIPGTQVTRKPGRGI